MSHTPAVIPARRRTRVLFLIPSLEGGGSERVFVNLIRHIDRSRFEPALAVLQKSGPFLTDLPADVPVYDLRVAGARFIFHKIIPLIWRLRPDIVISTLTHLNLVLLMAKPFFPRRLRIIVRESTVVSRLLTDVRYPRVWEWLCRTFYPKAERIVCQSQYMREDLIHEFGLPKNKILCIYNPVDVDRVVTLAAHHDNPFTAPGPHIVFAGRLSAEKGVDLLLEAMGHVIQVIPAAKLTILGQGTLRDSLVQKSAALGLEDCVTFSGFQSNPYPFLQNADVFVLTSSYEGLPNALLEALALGTPAVSVNCPGGVSELAELFSGRLAICPRDPQALAGQIVTILDQDRVRQRPSSSSRNTIPEPFRVSTALTAYERLFASAE